MIQYPINVSPQNIAVDAAQNIIVKYTFQGDYLSKNIIRIYDYDSDELAYTTFSGFIGYNGDQCGFTIPANVLSNGHKYVLQMCMIQFTLDGLSPLADMPVFGGKVEETSEDDTIHIKTGITSIYPWNYVDGKYVPNIIDDTQVTNMVIKINNESHNIISYESNDEIGYGVITLDEPFSFNVVGGMSYEIFSNFYITPQYYFMANDSATVLLTQNHYSNRIYVHGTYNQDQNVMIKKYNLKLYWSNNSGFVDSTGSDQDTGMRARLMEETNDIYSQNIEYIFWNPYYHDAFHLAESNDYYKIVCECTTQNDMVTTGEITFNVAPQRYPDITGNRLHEFTLWWDNEKGAVFHKLRGYGSSGIGNVGEYELFREDLDSGEIIKLQHHNYTQTGEYGAELIGYDITASTHGRYRYTLMEFAESDDMGHVAGGVVIPTEGGSYVGDSIFPSATIEINEASYYITELDMFMFNDEQLHPNEKSNKKINFRIGDTWQFMCEIENTTVTNNLDRAVHVGYSRYISSTSTDVNYESGTLSAMLGRMKCAEKEFYDTISIVKAWRIFITQPKTFLLKSQKGDVWLINVTDSPQTSYNESHWGVPTTFTFNWAECLNIANVELYSRIY